jgi:hypothetical protein
VPRSCRQEVVVLASWRYRQRVGVRLPVNKLCAIRRGGSWGQAQLLVASASEGGSPSRCKSACIFVGLINTTLQSVFVSAVRGVDDRFLCSAGCCRRQLSGPQQVQRCDWIATTTAVLTCQLICCCWLLPSRAVHGGQQPGLCRVRNVL